MSRNLFNLRVSEVTLCKAPKAGSAKILVLKSKEAEDKSKEPWERTSLFKALDDEKQIAYGYAAVPNEEDSEGDIITNEEIEKAAHTFMEIISNGEQKGKGTGVEHKIFDDVGHPVESAIDRDGVIAKSFDVPDDDIRPGGWWIGIKVADDHWESIKKGEINGFSIGGVSQAIEKAKEESHEGILQKILKAVTGKDNRPKNKLEKATLFEEIVKAYSFDELNEEIEVKEVLIEKTWVLVDSIFSIINDPDVSNKVQEVAKSTNQYLDLIGELKKAEETINSGDHTMSKETEEKILKALENVSDGLNKLTEKLDSTDNTDTDADTGTTDGTQDDTKSTDGQDGQDDNNAALDDRFAAIEKSIDALKKSVEKFSKTPNDPVGGRDGDPDTSDIQKSKSSKIVGTPLSFRQ